MTLSPLFNASPDLRGLLSEPIQRYLVTTRAHRSEYICCSCLSDLQRHDMCNVRSTNRAGAGAHRHPQSAQPRADRRNHQPLRRAMLAIGAEFNKQKVMN
jgi:hypothetical protein